MCNHNILNKKKSLGACLYLASVRSYGSLKNDEKNKKGRISGKRAIFKKNDNWSIARLGVGKLLP